jgi:hypothetical protein
MNPIRTASRVVVGANLKLGAWPLRRAAALLPGNGTGPRSAAELAIDQADAALRDAAGTLLRDNELREDARRRRKAAVDRAQAVALRTDAELEREEADERIAEGREEAAKKRQQARKQATRKRAQAQKTATARKQSVRQSAEQRERAAAERAAETEEQIESRARRERLEVLEERSDALREQEEALTAADEAQRLAEAAATAKAERKNP